MVLCHVLYNSLIPIGPISHRFFTSAFLSPSRRKPGTEIIMLDIAMLAIGLGFFALSAAYAYACDRL